VAILVAAQRFGGELLAGGDALGETLRFLDELARDDQVVDVRADRVVLGVAEHAGELPVHTNDAVVLVQNRNRFRRALEQRREIDVLGLQRVVETFPICHIDRDADRSADATVGCAQRLDSSLE